MPVVTGSLITEKKAIAVYVSVFVHDGVVARKKRPRGVWSSSISPMREREHGEDPPLAAASVV
jgi:hypothetical protein